VGITKLLLQFCLIDFIFCGSASSLCEFDKSVVSSLLQRITFSCELSFFAYFGISNKLTNGNAVFQLSPFA